jgi:hypothetical protein
MRKELLIGDCNVVGVVHKKGVMLCFVLDLHIGLTITAYFALMCRRLACQRLVVMY